MTHPVRWLAWAMVGMVVFGQPYPVLARQADDQLAQGISAYEVYRRYHAAIDLPILSRMQRLPSVEENTRTAVPYLLDVDLVETDSGAAIAFVERQFSGRTIETTRKEAAALEAFDKAETHLRAALADHPERKASYTYLMRLYALAERPHLARDVPVAMRQHFPEDPDTWAYLGYVAFHTGAYEAAAAHYEKALERMPDADRVAFEDIGYFLNKAEKEAHEAQGPAYVDRFWTGRDPRLLSAVNERQIEHFSRLVYADLRFGEMFSGKRGWETEPGQVVVRYGLPRAEARVSSDTDSYVYFHYGDLHFTFMDLVKADKLTFYSPSAASYQGPRNVHREWGHDFAIRGPETFRKLPERTDFSPPERVEFPYLVSVFKGPMGQADLYIPYGVQTPEASGHLPFQLDAGAFLLDETGLLDESRQSHGQMGAGRRYAFEEANVWVDAHHLTASPGDYEVSVEFETAEGSGGVGFHRSAVAVPDFGSGDFRLSDLMMAYGVEEEAAPAPGFVLRDGLSILPAPWGVYARTQPIYFYFEGYNLSQSADGTTRYAVEAVLVRSEKKKGADKLVRRAFGRGNKAGVSSRFEGTGTTPDEGQYLILDASSQEPGAYILAVRLTDQLTGRTAEARRNLVLE